MSNFYPSDIDREQFNKIKPLLESARKKTRPRTVDLYDVICGISYLLKSGCQWRMLPKEFPKWRTCHYYFTLWSEKVNDSSESILEKVIPKRWVVERSFSWLEKCRRLWKNCERKLNTSLHMVILAFIVLFVKRF
jgi:transposase